MANKIKTRAIFAAALTTVVSGSPSYVAKAAPPAATLFADGKAIVRDHMSIEIVGHGPDIVLIPGLASSREVWRATAERLRGRYRLHLVQIGGFAGEPPRGNVGPGFFGPVLADLDAYCASLSRPIVIGHSLGGALGLALAQAHPTHLSKLLIVDSLPFYGVLMGGPKATAASVAPMAEQMRQASAGMSEPMVRGMSAQMVTAPADVDRIVGWALASTPTVVGAAMADDMTTDLRPGLAAMTTPVTVLYEVPLEGMMTNGYAALPHKTLIAVPNSKHFIMYDQPTRFAAEVDAFLAR